MKKGTATHTNGQIKQNQRIEDFFKCVDKDTDKTKSDCIETALKEDRETSKKRRLSPGNKTPTKNAHVILEVTPSPSKSPSLKKPRSCRKTPVKNLFNQQPSNINSFNVDVIERFVRQSPKKTNAKTETEDLITDLECCILSTDENIPANDLRFGEDSWDNSFGVLDSLLTLDLSTSQHCKVLEVNEVNNEKQVLLESTKSKEKCWCTLSGYWRDVPITKGTMLHVKAELKSSTWTVSNDFGLVVFEPDFLVSSTSVVASLFCKRRSVITERYRTFDAENKYMVLGSIVHSLLQLCLKTKSSEISQIELQLQNLLKTKDIVKMLYAASIKIEDLEEQLKEYIPQIQVFIEQYVNEKGDRKIKEGNWRDKIDAIEDIEENFWCPELGVKGKVDVTVKVRDSIMPVELKTGKASLSLEHRGQVMLYVLMMQKFGYHVNSGLLFYLKDCILKEIKPSVTETRDIVILRNELVYYLSKTHSDVEASYRNSTKSGLLPKPINHHSACKSCSYNTICCSYLKSEEYDLTNYKHLKSVQDEVLGHLSEEHLKYFIHWSSLLAMEAMHRTADEKSFREVFTVEANKREKNGKCISNLKITEVEECGIHYLTSFAKPGKDGKNFLSSGIYENTYVVISTNTRPAIATGFVTNVSQNSISIAADRDLKKNYADRSFHVDTYDSDNAVTFNMANLALLLEQTEQTERLRKFIIDRQKPTFRTKLPRIVAKTAAPILQRLNRVQQRAVLRAISANDYILITGMPGTGKTSTIVALIQLLVELDQSVIVTSHTHSAVDNVCMRLVKYGVEGILRLGGSTKIHPSLIAKSEVEVTKNCRTPEELEKCYGEAKIVAVTCLGSKHPLLSKRLFDVCIVDESTQVLQPSVVRLLLASKKFVLVGDPRQLPPVVRNTAASVKGMSESLFERLDCAESNVVLNLNYRMNRKITQLANDLTYKGELLVATEEVASAHLTLPKPKALDSHSWVKDVLDESLDKSVTILDTGPTNHINASDLNLKNNTGEFVEAQHCSNAVESVVISLLVDVLLKAGVPKEFIGVIAPYRAQIAQLSSLLQKTGVDVSTVDRFQGKDKEVIIVSCTRNFERAEFVNREYEILEDDRRINVIVTRAKQKLIIVGDVKSVRTYKPFERLFSCLEKECFVRVSLSHEDLCSMIKSLSL